MPKPLTFLIALGLLTSIFVLTDWKMLGERKEAQENFTISIEPGNAFEETDPQNEHFVIVVRLKQGKSLNLGNWSVSGSRGQSFRLPEAAAEFKQGEINELEEIKITEESELIIATGQSPVGTSFRENPCSGLLGQYQNFSPALPAGPHGFESYNTCFKALRSQENFLGKGWRIFLDHQEELWLNSNEIIIVSDENGQELAGLKSGARPLAEIVKILEKLERLFASPLF